VVKRDQGDRIGGATITGCREELLVYTDPGCCFAYFIQQSTKEADSNMAPRWRGEEMRPRGEIYHHPIRYPSIIHPP